MFTVIIVILVEIIGVENEKLSNLYDRIADFWDTVNDKLPF